MRSFNNSTRSFGGTSCLLVMHRVATKQQHCSFVVQHTFIASTMPGTWTAKNWRPEHDALIQSLLEKKPRLIEKSTTPKALSDISSVFKKKIYDCFTYGTTNNKFSSAKKRFFAQGKSLFNVFYPVMQCVLTINAFSFEFYAEEEAKIKKDIESISSGGEDLNSDGDDILYADENAPNVLVGPAKKEAPPDVAPLMAQLEEQLHDSPISIFKPIDTDPTVMYHIDDQKVTHAHVRFVPLHAVIKNENDINKVIPKLDQDGFGMELKCPKPKTLYRLKKVSKLPCWDKIWEDSACQGRSAMINEELKITDKHEHAGLVWDVQHIKFKEKMEVIESFHIAPDDSELAVIVCLKGPNSAYKKKKITEHVTHRSFSHIGI